MASRQALVVAVLAQHLTRAAGQAKDAVSLDDGRTCKGFEKQWGECEDQPPCRDCVPVACKFAAWQDWYAAGGCIGLDYRHRSVASTNNECGEPCSGPKIESRANPSMECTNEKQDCVLGDWESWSVCSGPLDQKKRTRKIETEPRFGGEPCTNESLSVTEPCNSETPVDCVTSDWGQWTHCSATCGGGYNARLRRVLAHAQHGGKTCEAPLRETLPCSTQACGDTQNCEFSDWTLWSKCGTNAQKYRTREVQVPAAHDGVPCSGPLRQTIGCPIEDIVVDCEVSEWSPWTSCDGQMCAEKRRERFRHLMSNGGNCSTMSLHETEPCGPADASCEANPSDLNCMFGEWRDWSVCSSMCGSGYTERKRVVVRNAKRQGKHCVGPLREVLPCTSSHRSNSSACGVTDCQWGQWEDWSGCSCTCGGGAKRRNRVVIVSPMNGGQLCAPQDKSEIAPCNTQSCNKCIDGAWMAWTEWSSCSATCDVGFRSRHRDVQRQPNSCGKPVLGDEDQYEKCIAPTSCTPDQDCKVSEWSDWTGCSGTCWGVRERNRYVNQTTRGHGATCKEALKQIAPCNPADGEDVPASCGRDLPRPCTFSSWSAWTDCPVECNGGQQERSRHILTPAQLQGEPCQGSLHQVRPCNTKSCDRHCVDCKWGPWEDWGGCTKCGGQRYRHRHIAVMPNECGVICDAKAAKEVAKCPGDDWQCPHDMKCGWTPWQTIGEPCSVTCGSGTKMMARQLNMTMMDKHYVVPEEQLPTSKKSCKEIQAINPNGWTDTILKNKKGLYNGSIGVPDVCGGKIECAGFGDFQAAKKMCEDAGARLCRQHEYYPGLEGAGRGCKYDLELHWTATPCNSSTGNESYMAVEVGQYALDPKMSCLDATSKLAVHGRCCADVTVEPPITDYFFAGPEDMTCGGTQVKYVPCEATAQCPTAPPPRDCKFSPWGAWNEPSVALLCERSRNIEDMGTPGGKECIGPLVETKPCVNTKATVQDCMWSDWDQWSACAAENMQRFRGRTIMQMPSKDGKQCEGPVQETGSCSGEVPKPEQCVLADWGAWEACSHSCGGGVKHRKRADASGYGFAQRSAAGGHACEGMMEEIESCNDVPCDTSVEKDCILGQWGTWSDCKHSDVSKTRVRRVEQQKSGDGDACTGTLEEMEPCPMDIDCEISDWTEWDQCDKPCGGGQTNRHRQITRYPRNNGTVCPTEIVQTEGCNRENCGQRVDCQVDEWTPWGACSATCGTGQQSRTRFVTNLAKDGGLGCNMSLVELQACPDLAACPTVDCVWAEWSDWGDCSCDCDGGQRSRDRNIKTMPLPGGKFCDPNSKEEVEPCNTQPCHGNCVDGLWDDWTPWVPCSATCEGGLTWRTRQVLREADDCGKPATGPSRQTESCNANVSCTVDVDCEFGDWREWSDCTKQCSGIKRRSRDIVVQGRGKGKWCEGALKETWPCNPGPNEDAPPECSQGPTLDCKVSDWLEWETCSVSCGGGQKKRVRQLINEPENGGKGCEDTMAETVGCNAEACTADCPKVDCKWGDWGHWSACDKCGGQRKRFRNVVTQPFCGGAACAPHMAEELSNCTRQCHTPSFCAWTDWQVWGDCTVSCGKGSRSRIRELRLQDATYYARLLDADEDVLEQKFQSLRDRSAGLENRRHQELLVAFTCGLLTLSFGSFVFRRLARPSTSTQEQVSLSEFREASGQTSSGNLRYERVGGGEAHQVPLVAVE